MSAETDVAAAKAALLDLVEGGRVSAASIGDESTAFTQVSVGDLHKELARSQQATSTSGTGRVVVRLCRGL